MEFISTTDGVVIRQTQEVGPVLDRNAELRWADDRKGYTRDRTLRHVADIPPVLYYQWLKDYGIDACNPDHWEFVKRKLNDIEQLYLRTSTGRI